MDPGRLLNLVYPSAMLCKVPSGRSASVIIVSGILGVVLAQMPLAAQWFKYPTPGVPRKPDGSVNMMGPTPRMADGKPDFSGIWMTGEPNGRRTTGTTAGAIEVGSDDKPGDPINITGSRHMNNLGIDIPEGLPYQSWLVPLVKERTANNAKDDPHVRCFPDNFIR